MTITIKQRTATKPLPENTAHAHLCEHPTLSRIYQNRGITDAEELDYSAQQLVSYHQLHGIQGAVKTIADAMRKQSKITIVGDFDADGATSTALCLLALTEMGANNVDHLVPNRFAFGYGLTPQIVEVAERQGAELIITVDSGISCLAGVRYAKSKSIKVIVTDHHLPGENLPDADAIVNPNQPNCPFPSKNLAGVGVAFYVMLALRAHLSESGWFTENGIKVPNLANYLDLVAIGTVADVVQLDRVNRILVYQGLQRIKAKKCRPLVLSMLEVAKREPNTLTASDLGFVIGPRLNAAGRLDDMSLGIAGLVSHSHEHSRTIAIELDRLNHERRAIEASMQQEALALLEHTQLDDHLPSGLVVYNSDFHAGVVGIVAGRLKDKFIRPTIVFAQESEDTLKGSARSVKGVHIRDVLERVHTQYPHLIIKFGGHSMAAGLSIEKQHLAAFTTAFQTSLENWRYIIEQSGSIVTDGCIDDIDLSVSFADLIRQAGPWGQGFEEPLFDGVFKLVQQRIVGEKHLKMVVESENGAMLDAIAFNVDLVQWPNLTVKSIHIAYKLDVNKFRGQTGLQLIVEAINTVN